MIRLLFTFLFLCSALVVQSQVNTYVLTQTGQAEFDTARVTQPTLDDSCAAIRADFPSGADSTTFATNYRLDSTRTGLDSRIGLKLNIADTSAMLSPYLRKANGYLYPTAPLSSTVTVIKDQAATNSALSLGTLGATITTDALGSSLTTTSGLSLTNNTAAVLGAQQYSPPLFWRGFGWGTTSSTSQAVNFRAYVVPVQAAVPTGTWTMQSQIGGGGWGDRLHVQSDATTLGLQSYGLILSGANILNSSAGSLSIYNSNVQSGRINFSPTGVIIDYSGTAKTTTSGTTTLLTSNVGFAPTSGTGIFNQFSLAPTINQTGGANGITRGLYVNPTLTAAADFKAIESTAGSVKLADTYVAGSGSLAGSLLDLTQTWNTTGTPTAIKMNITEAASNISSLFMDLQLNGGSRFKISKGGAITTSGTTHTLGTVQVSTLQAMTNTDITLLANWAGSTGIFLKTIKNTSQVAQIIPNTPDDYTSGTSSILRVTNNFQPTSGTGTNTAIAVDGTINQTGGANGITRGFYSNPTLTAAADYRAFESTNTTGKSIVTGTAPSIFGGTITFPTPFTLGATSVTSTGTQLNYLSGATGTAGSGKLIFQTSPALVTPDLGAATGASLVLTGSVSADNLLSGTYTPTLTNTTNIVSSAASQCTYMRVGNTVTVSGQYDIRTSSTAAATVLGISLPIASNFTTIYQAGGTANATAFTESGGIQANATSDIGEVKYISVGSGTHTMTFTFTYQIL